MKFKKIILVFILIISMFTMFGCGNNYTADMESVSYRKASNIASVSDNSTKEYVVTTNDRMMVYYADIKITVANTDETAITIRAKLDTLGGYEENVEYSDSGYKYFRLRVPTENLNEFINSINSTGKVDSLSITSRDITEAYTNSVNKLNSLIRYKQELEKLYDNATELSDILAIQEKIYEVSTEIDYYTKESQNYKKQSDYSTVYLTMYNESQVYEDTFFEKIKNIFMGSIKSIGIVFTNILYIIVAITPYIVLIGAILGIYVLVKYIVCKTKKIPFTIIKKNKKTKENEEV